ncbi:MAG TPA: succinate dehydrogenase, cytochrome b556 subunit [Gammaproteobacteria bacterium]|nr:succinate dehydrogenase, cytochrome b556 subunit [Gammaproteobacteria bacterium]
MKPTDPFNRPIFLDLRRIRFPVGAIASILHRITGVILLAAIPAALGLIAYSSRSPDHFRTVARWLDGPVIAVLLALVMGAAVHHLLAGLRILFMDAGWGVDRATARRTAWGSLMAAAVAVVATAGWLLSGGGGHVP